MKLTKIQEFIEKNNIQPGDAEYHTQRALEKTGKIRVLAIKGTAHAEYICPYCGHHGYTTKTWKKPFSVNCEECGKLLRVQKLKYLVKKEIKEAEGKK
ncbi:MAG: hypothetical protein DRP06_03110 [Candidatus Aenigmatarchaeota archaeon]|nr:MAG: hypothetical protein DRP06_03110 [Candidatus Aenigmarchaeota archaeon]